VNVVAAAPAFFWQSAIVSASVSTKAAWCKHERQLFEHLSISSGSLLLAVTGSARFGRDALLRRRNRR
jgi:uncharacterized membrane protein YphA (DoxX/SURF4 family)